MQKRGENEREEGKKGEGNSEEKIHKLICNEEER
jgi:hypothetical protein